MMARDRAGLGWRPCLSAGILANLDRIDIVEVIADDWFGASKSKLQQLRTLGAQVPIELHAVGLGTASSAPTDRKKLSAMARLFEAVQPESWSEHLAFVRAGEIELGHLAAPPRNEASVAGGVHNLMEATKVVGVAPHVENIATIIDPPASTLSEFEWTRQILDGSGCHLLLDLHNVHSNAHNFGSDAARLLEFADGGRVQYIHIAGGYLGPEGRIVDDHKHDVPDPVYALLTEVAQRAPRPLTVILERDGEYPAMADLLTQLDRARAAMAQGRRTVA